ncbi:MAG: ribonuclease P protein component [Candidatus Azotimanducaceae bacterium]|jgi:ribonuclease P protein component
MLAKKERLTRKEFDLFFRSGKRHNTSLLQLIHTKHDSFHGAVVVGKKVHKKAVDRNKTRRRLYAVLYSHKKQQNLSGIYIVITKPAASCASYALLKKDLIDLIGRTKDLSKISRQKNT